MSEAKDIGTKTVARVLESTGPACLDLMDHLDISSNQHDPHGWENGAGKVIQLECTVPPFTDEIQDISGETIEYKGRPIPYKIDGIFGYIVVEMTGKCLFFYVNDGDFMYDELGNVEIKKQ